MSDIFFITKYSVESYIVEKCFFGGICIIKIPQFITVKYIFDIFVIFIKCSFSDFDIYRFEFVIYFVDIYVFAKRFCDTF